MAVHGIIGRKVGMTQIFLSDGAAVPVTVAVNNLQGSYSVDWNVVMAGAVLVALPTLLIYVFLGRFFVRGLTAGAVKG